MCTDPRNWIGLSQAQDHFYSCIEMWAFFRGEGGEGPIFLTHIPLCFSFFCWPAFFFLQSRSFLSKTVAFEGGGARVPSPRVPHTPPQNCSKPKTKRPHLPLCPFLKVIFSLSMPNGWFVIKRHVPLYILTQLRGGARPVPARATYATPNLFKT